MYAPHPSESQPPANTGLVLVGGLVALVGVMLLVDRLGDRDTSLLHSWWPFVLIIMGAARLATPRRSCDGRPRSIRSGVWLIVVGLWGLVSESHLYGLTYQTAWPLLVIASGAMIVWRSLEGPPEPSARREQ